MRTRHHVLQVIVSVVGLGVLAACDPIAGVRREVDLSGLPSRESVEAGIRAVPEVRRLEYRRVTPATRWSVFEGVIREPAYDRFRYSGGGTWGTIAVQPGQKGPTVLEMSCMKIGVMEREDADRARAMMDQIYASLRRAIPGVPPPTEIREKLIRVR